MQRIKNYLHLIKFSHTIFAMPFAVIGFCIGVKYAKIPPTNTQIGIKLILVVLCMITARSAAMAYNRYLDRAFDAKNPRTALREIPSGVISPRNALYFTIFSCILFLSAAYCINKMCFYLAPIALFIILFYSYTKRFTALCHLWLGLGLSLAPIGAYVAAANQFNVLPILFSFVVLTWVSGFDIIYALQDVAFDQSQNLHSIPSLLGLKNAILVSRGLHIASSIFVIVAGIYGSFHELYVIAALLFIALLVYQQSIVKPDDVSKINLAFMTSNGIASILFGILVVIDIISTMCV